MRFQNDYCALLSVIDEGYNSALLSCQDNKNSTKAQASDNPDTMKVREFWSFLLCSFCQRHKATRPTSDHRHPTDSPKKSKTMYSIISEVSSGAMGADKLEKLDAPSNITSSESDESDDVTCYRCSRLRTTFESCFRSTNDFYDGEMKEIETIPFSYEVEENSICDLGDDTSTLIGTPRVVRISSNTGFAPINYVKTCISKPEESIELPIKELRDQDEEEYTDSCMSEQEDLVEQDNEDCRDDKNTLNQDKVIRDTMHIFFTPMPGQFNQEDRPVLGVSFPHPAGLRTLEREFPSLRMYSPSNPDCTISKNLVFSFGGNDAMPNCQKPERQPKMSPSRPEWPIHERTGSFPSLWTRNIYHPVFRLAKELPNCGTLQDKISTMDVAPFDEVEDDFERNPFDEVATDLDDTVSSPNLE